MSWFIWSLMCGGRLKKPRKHLVAVDFEGLGSLKGEHSAVGVSGDGVWSDWFCLFDCGVICHHGFLYVLEACFASVKASCSESIYWSVCYMFGQIGDEEDLGYSGVKQPKVLTPWCCILTTGFNSVGEGYESTRSIADKVIGKF